ncbi:rhamnogalacturonan acetylesterase [Terfezia boudieri ATCC MYA-4762]|uniref:Rhamnogalacturonan acetylesterase n=1 Tax=Terfezia boudieri ATCC MYA-4762 TaxID=1051890 RepID=A0A3N4LFV7_9PEZI|nr:rhamnogalacturonan acetylesterase [Terfezia boudieri ATCC MYA-4762]
MFFHSLSLVFLLASFLTSVNPLPSKTKRAPTLWLVSDSTCASYNPKRSPIQGFGYFLPEYFTLNVANRARGGRSTRSYINEGLWVELMGLIKPNDIVMIEMGHNDMGTPGVGHDIGRDCAVLSGTGNRSIQVINKHGQTETVYTFGHYLRSMVFDLRHHGAIPILSGMVPRMIWSAGNSTLDPNRRVTNYAKQIADELKTGWVDHTKYSVERFQALGKNTSIAMFPQDHTHTNAAGAKLNAETFVTGVKCGTTQAVKDLAKYLSDEGKSVMWRC